MIRVGEYRHIFREPFASNVAILLLYPDGAVSLQIINDSSIWPVRINQYLLVAPREGVSFMCTAGVPESNASRAVRTSFDQ
jgi:hypothetical protein